MNCPSCKGSVKPMAGGVHCEQCGDLVQDESGAWIPAPGPLQAAPSDSPKPPAADKVEEKTPPAAPVADPDADLYWKVPLGASN